MRARRDERAKRVDELLITIEDAMHKLRAELRTPRNHDQPNKDVFSLTQGVCRWLHHTTRRISMKTTKPRGFFRSVLSINRARSTAEGSEAASGGEAG